jgi:tetratricopeptide (TPR) repeat protein
MSWLLLLALFGAGGAGRQTPADLADRAESDFAQGRIAESVADYDRLAALIPSLAPELWQRGVGLYYLGRYDECAAQFASFHALDPRDVEDAAWHFFCVARGSSIDRARRELLQAGPDPRVMRAQVYDLLRGTLSPKDFIDQAEANYPIAQFYAHLYVGLYLESLGDRKESLSHVKIAAEDRYRLFGGFMNVVAQVHVKMRTATK